MASVGRTAPAERASYLHLTARALWASAWLGWQAEANWASPLFYAAYALARPISAAVLVVAMFVSLLGSQTGTGQFAYLFLGQALFLFVSTTVQGVGSTILDDRERWQTLRYVYLVPVSRYTYLVGRGATRFASATLGVVVTIGAGLMFFGLRLDPNQLDVPLALLGLLIGAIDSILLGICVAGLSLVIARHSWMMPDAIAAAFHILCGTIFPIDILPPPLLFLGLMLPVTYWLELMRRALGAGTVSALLGAMSTPSLLEVLVLSTVALAIFARLSFDFFERLARDRGLIENTTGD